MWQRPDVGHFCHHLHSLICPAHLGGKNTFVFVFLDATHFVWFSSICSPSCVTPIQCYWRNASLGSNSWDVLCGFLLCANMTAKPLSGVLQGEVTSLTIYHQNKYMECRGGHAALDDGSDLGYVEDGTPCGPNMMCLDRRCLPLAAFNLSTCPGSSSSHTCSDHGIWWGIRCKSSVSLRPSRIQEKSLPLIPKPTAATSSPDSPSSAPYPNPIVSPFPRATSATEQSPNPTAHHAQEKRPRSSSTTHLSPPTPMGFGPWATISNRSLEPLLPWENYQWKVNAPA
ncbi:hypothetical protein Z043_103505 [Scleropages formosus]|uniref:ADAM cysteine-rich domain-containing protein n=1 Tax=Scleropages formosus TaxID=113540 RepID=A0A0P7V5U1_SCLFO|nr:hypothetical protein Z043_103505 [Scleropages formosus]